MVIFLILLVTLKDYEIHRATRTGLVPIAYKGRGRILEVTDPRIR